jgi:hypothetical protein
MEQGSSDARRKAGHHVGLWILAAGAAVVGLIALIWIVAHSAQQASAHSHLCRPAIKKYTVVEVDALSPENTPNIGDVQTLTGVLYDNATDAVIGNTTGSCITVDNYHITNDDDEDVLYYVQVCTQVFNLFDPKNETEIMAGFVATGNYLAFVGNGTYANDAWAITGGFGDFLGANGQSIVDTIAEVSEEDGYLENWLFSVPCNIVA